MSREDVVVPSGDLELAAWLWRPDGATKDVPCVVMAQGFSLTRHDGFPAIAEGLAAGGYAALAFDYRGFGDSPGEPRQRFRRAEQRADLRAALHTARALGGVDSERIVPFGFSFGANHVLHELLDDDAGILAAVALCPVVDGLARVLKTPPLTTAQILPRAIADALGRHNTIPVTAQPGSFGAMPFPGEADGFDAAVGPSSPWRNEISPQVFLGVGLNRPVTKAARIRVPLFVGIGERDISVANAAKLAAGAPQGEAHRYDEDHFTVLTGDAPKRIAADVVGFLDAR